MLVIDSENNRIQAALVQGVRPDGLEEKVTVFEKGQFVKPAANQPVPDLAAGQSVPMSQWGALFGKGAEGDSQ